MSRPFGFLIAKCEPCDALVCDYIDEQDPEHVTCKGCGAKLTPFAGPATMIDGKVWRAGMSRTKGLLIRGRSAFEPQRSRDGALAHHERFIHRDSDRYFEKVTMCDTGEVIHLSDEPLSEHRGHGSDRSSQGNDKNHEDGDMASADMPRVNELRALIDAPANPSAYFRDFDESIRVEPSKKQVWLAREIEFQRLDSASWEFLKAEARPYLTACDAEGRGWEQLISILNQARAYNYLIDRGCSGVSFIPRAKRQGQKTPDLQAVENGGDILCEVKTINISRNEVNRRHSGEAGSTTNVLPDAFFNKLDTTILNATNQLAVRNFTGNAKLLVFAVINFDDFLCEYKMDYFDQIDRHIGQTLRANLEIVFFNQRTTFHRNISMRHAQVVNEASYPI
jgi:hypothetical protein